MKLLSGFFAKTAKSRCQEQRREYHDGGNEGSESRDWHKDGLRSCREGSSQHLEMYCKFKTPSIDSLVVFSHITLQEFSLWAENGIRDEKPREVLSEF